MRSDFLVPRVDFNGGEADSTSSKPTVTEIVREHREAMKQLRKELRDPKEDRKFLIRAGILSKDGQRLAKRYR